MIQPFKANKGFTCSNQFPRARLLKMRHFCCCCFYLSPFPCFHFTKKRERVRRVRVLVTSTSAVTCVVLCCAVCFLFIMWCCARCVEWQRGRVNGVGEVWVAVMCCVEWQRGRMLGGGGGGGERGGGCYNGGRKGTGVGELNTFSFFFLVGNGNLPPTGTRAAFHFNCLTQFTQRPQLTYLHRRRVLLPLAFLPLNGPMGGYG